MKLPLILSDNGEVNLFESVEDLERYVESPDIINYRVFDSNGDVLKLNTSPTPTRQKGLFNIVRITPVQVVIGESHVNEVAELEERLREFLLRVTGKSYIQSPLTELLTVLQTTIGYTR
jgi:hypothetical protein